ncbi:MAG: CAP domain-containing protein [Chloroflexota bacterium]|nr:CAP domain-containing protein [Chloroflexota bacterium]
MPASGRIFTALPFALVVVLAIALAAFAFVSAPRGAEVATSAAPTAVAATTTAGPATARPSTPASPTATQPSAQLNDAVEMLRAHNALRAAIGAPIVRSDDRVTAAAQRHAEYLSRNNTLGHMESSGDPGFTGATVQDRLAARGYTNATASEVATSFGTGVDGVRSLWLLPYHRLGLMHPNAIVAGWGHAEQDGRSVSVGVIVYDFSASAPERVLSPAAGQVVRPLWDGEESPDVLPAGAARPVGYPVMVVYSGARSTDLRNARVTGPDGAEIATHLVPQIYERDYVAIVPAQALAAGRRYHVRLELTVTGLGDITEEWDFETER